MLICLPSLDHFYSAKAWLKTNQNNATPEGRVVQLYHLLSNRFRLGYITEPKSQVLPTVPVCFEPLTFIGYTEKRSIITLHWMLGKESDITLHLLLWMKGFAWLPCKNLRLQNGYCTSQPRSSAAGNVKGYTMDSYSLLFSLPLSAAEFKLQLLLTPITKYSTAKHHDFMTLIVQTPKIMQNQLPRLIAVTNKLLCRHNIECHLLSIMYNLLVHAVYLL